MSTCRSIRRSTFMPQRASRSIAREFGDVSGGLVTDKVARSTRIDKVFVDWDPEQYPPLGRCAVVAARHPISHRGFPLAWEDVEAACRRDAPEALIFLAWDVLGRSKRWEIRWHPYSGNRRGYPPSNLVSR